MQVSIIAAIDRCGGIGRRGDLLFHISADLRRFKALTMGNTIVMGRRTFESLPKGALPGRRNIVVTRQPDYTAEGAETAGNIREAIAMSSTPVFIIGGGQIYTQSIALADRLELTVIDAKADDADTFFPPVRLDDFRIERIERPDTEPGCSFVTLSRVR
ncbi:MAG: dihydrofolate reductase [Muribaculaceae bacterium]|nr:dihydrofolate reductase [Muribaculaceae bacterium]